jgi:hypothetical protein
VLGKIRKTLHKIRKELHQIREMLRKITKNEIRHFSALAYVGGALGRLSVVMSYGYTAIKLSVKEECRCFSCFTPAI